MKNYISKLGNRSCYNNMYTYLATYELSRFVFNYFSFMFLVTIPKTNFFLKASQSMFSCNVCWCLSIDKYGWTWMKGNVVPYNQQLFHKVQHYIKNFLLGKFLTFKRIHRFVKAFACSMKNFFEIITHSAPRLTCMRDKNFNLCSITYRTLYCMKKKMR